MIALKKGLASLAVGLALTALASPSYAQEGGAAGRSLAASRFNLTRSPFALGPL